MPVITVDSEDLKSLIGRKLSDDELRRVLPLNKLLIEDWKGTELKLEVTPDRPDLFSAEGMARQASSWLGISAGLYRPKVWESKIELKASRVSLRPFITCGVVRNVRMAGMIKSIMQLQETLDLTLGRDRKKVAIGIHDISKVEPPFSYREVLPEEISFIPLGLSRRMNLMQIIKSHPKGVKYAHLVRGSSRWPIITDSKNQVLSFPPIINGELTKVTEQTTDLFIDITGPDERSINHCLNILATALEKRGGRIEGVKIGGRVKPDLSPRPMKVSAGEARKMLGVEISNTEMQSLLERMGYGASVRKDAADVLIPAFRADILHPVDIIEDMAIAYGLNDFIPEMPRLPSTGGADRTEELSNVVRQLLVGMGFQEVMNYTLTSRERQFSRMNANPEEVVEISNPVSAEYSVCRRWMIPNLLENCSSNKHRRFPQRIFEVADCVVPDKRTDTGTSNTRKLSGLITHSQASLAETISSLNALAENLGVKWEIKPHTHGTFIEGRCGAVFLPGKRDPTGIFGEISPKVLSNLELNNPAAAFELDLQRIFEALR